MSHESGKPASAPTKPRKRRRLLRGLRFLWLLAGATLLTLLIFEGLARVGFAIKDAVRPTPIVDPRLVAEGYDGASWVKTHFEEYHQLVADWHSYVNMRLRPIRGETITVLPGGVRKSWRGETDAARPPLNVWVLGGSAAWGIGARDDFTIPSLLAKELDRRGIDVVVTNFAEIGYVSTQELIWLELQLRAGLRPDVIVCYDGANEVLSALQNGEAGWPVNEANRRRAFEVERSAWSMLGAGLYKAVADSALYRLVRALSPRLGRPGGAGAIPSDWSVPRLATDAMAESILDTYRANCELIRALAERYNVKLVFCWQPLLFSKATPSDFERDELAKYDSMQPLYKTTISRLRERVAHDRDLAFVHDLSAIFDRDPRTRFGDFCHTTEAANAFVARAIADEVETAIQSGPRRTGSK